jgi:lipid-A-disaccharide synthase
MSKKLFIVTGEHSGDLHASFIVRELKKRLPDIEIEAVGGENLKAENVKLFHDHSDMSVVGLDFIFKLREHLRLGQNIIQYLQNNFCADLVLLIDYGGFNIRLAQYLKKANFKVFYYILPQVWATRKGRLKKIAAYVDKAMLILPFEEEIHKKAGVSAEYVGHPLMSQIPPPITKEQLCYKYKLDVNRPVIGLFPGSRKVEIRLITPVFLKTAMLIQKKLPEVQFCLAKASNIEASYLKKQIDKIKHIDKLNLKILENANYDLLSGADFLILASGTVTLEAAIYKTPMILSYKSYLLAYLIYLMIRYVDKIGLPNLILKKDAVPEFIQITATPQILADKALSLVSEGPTRNKMLQDLADVNKALTDKVASATVAERIVEELCSQAN